LLAGVRLRPAPGVRPRPAPGVRHRAPPGRALPPGLGPDRYVFISRPPEATRRCGTCSRGVQAEDFFVIDPLLYMARATSVRRRASSAVHGSGRSGVASDVVEM